MELRYLATFQTVERVGSFAKAADALSYAPSTITLHMQHLETELGFKLFVRQGKHIQLSTAGQALYEQVDVLLQQARTLEQTMKAIVAGETGSLRFGVIEPAASVCLMPLLAQFCREYPNMQVTLEVTSTRFICQRVAMGQLEIGLCSPPPAELGLTFEPLFFEPIALLIPKSGWVSLLLQELSAEFTVLSRQKRCRQWNCADDWSSERLAKTKPDHTYPVCGVGLLLASERVKRSGMMVRLKNTRQRASTYRDQAIETLERSSWCCRRMYGR